MRPKILLVDDDSTFRSTLKSYLDQEFYEVTVAKDGPTALALLPEVKPDIVILDVRLPHQDGLEVCLAIKRSPRFKNIGIIMTSGQRVELVDKVTGLEIGADVYLLKPFAGRELLAQIKALWRRLDPSFPPSAGWLQIDEVLEINFDQRLVQLNKVDTKLTKLELELLRYLVSKANFPCTYDELGREVWQWGDEPGDNNTIIKGIANLRRKIEVDPSQPNYIQTVYAVGYKFVVPTGTEPRDLHQIKHRKRVKCNR